MTHFSDKSRQYWGTQQHVNYLTSISSTTKLLGTKPNYFCGS